LQAVKCHSASSESKAVANPSAIYAILSKILIDAIFSNMIIEGYKIVGDNALQMIIESTAYDN
jgi:hypothetical protein